MTTAAKITLSAKELELVCDTSFILTKHAIIQKVYQLFGETLPALENIIQHKKATLPPAIFSHSPKISKGENYQLLPYVMLDYPRYFSKEDAIAIRTFFWWGNFFSVCLQVSGVYKQNAAIKVLEQFNGLQNEGYFICVESNPWEHHFEETNFILASHLTKTQAETILKKPFLKIAKKFRLEEWDDIPGFIVNAFDRLSDLIPNDQAPSR
jgi:hypothetical protein